MKTIKIKMIKTHALMNNKDCIGNKIGCEHILTGYIKEGGWWWGRVKGYCILYYEFATMKYFDILWNVIVQ